MYQLTKRTCAERLPSTRSCCRSLPTAICQGMSISRPAERKKRRPIPSEPLARHSRNVRASVPALIRAELIGQDWTQRFCVFDDVEYLRLRQTSCEFGKSGFICWNLILEVASKAYSPPFTLLRQNGAKAPIRLTGRDNRSHFAMQVFQPTTVKPSLIADVDLNLLLTRLGISQSFQP